jgi:hypothetical protein
MYDPINNICRDIFCVENFILTPNGCVKDESFNSTNENQNEIKVPNELELEFALSQRLCVENEKSNEQFYCSNTLLRDDENIHEDIQGAFAAVLDINPSRIKDLELISHKIISDVSRLSNKPVGHDDNAYFIERNIYQIRLLNRDPSSQEKDVLQSYFNLIALGLENFFINLNDHKANLSNVILIKRNNYWSWCEDHGDEKVTIVNEGFRLLATVGKDKQYFVYVNATDTLYGTGYYFLTLLYETQFIDKRTNLEEYYRYSFDPNSLNNINSLNNCDAHKPWLNDYSKLELMDVTDYMIEKDSDNSVLKSYLVICNRAPKIRVKCLDYTKIRVKKCELEYVTRNRSYCWPALRTCYSIDEYEDDHLYPNSFIQICKLTNKTKEKMEINENYLQDNFHPNDDMNINITGWVSLFANIVSFTSMVLTLITYALFNELRNIPGWNIINLTVALTLAQFSFLSGSLFNGVDFLCFIIALSTHYFFLAAFFWMNVIAFDLYRNFRDKSSHILLQSVTIRDRLPQYAMYAWFSPMFIVLSAIVVDLAVKDIRLNAPFRPCYAGYLPGCLNYRTGIINEFNRTITKVLTYSDPSSEQEYLNNSACLSSDADILAYIFNKTCWIQNGRANLIFFGLPIAIIIIINAFYYFLTVYNIRKKKKKQKKNKIRRFSRMKLPGDEDVKFYIQMAFIMGFTWITGFLLTSFSADDDHSFFSHLLVYVFILSNASIGVFIFAAFILKPKVRKLYKTLFSNKVVPLLKTMNPYKSKASFQPDGKHSDVKKNLNVIHTEYPQSPFDLRTALKIMSNSEVTLNSYLTDSEFNYPILRNLHQQEKLERNKVVFDFLEFD